MVTIQLTDEEAELFKQFRQYQFLFQLLLKAGIFTPYNGSKVIHKNGATIREIETILIQRF